jgi:ribosomal protein S11
MNMKHMNTQETILQLEDLKLKGMAECYKGHAGVAGERMAHPSDLFVAARMAEAERQYQQHGAEDGDVYLKDKQTQVQLRAGRCHTAPMSVTSLKICS